MTFLGRLSVLCWVPAMILSQSVETGSVIGRVLDSSTGEPISGATVRLSTQDLGSRTGMRPTSSEPDGTFRFDSVPAGRYVALARKAGFVQDSVLNDTVLTVDARSSASEIVVRLTPRGSIAGKVVDQNGLPQAGAQVYLLLLDPTFSPAMLQPVDAHAVTDRSGHYSLTKLRGGFYYVLALPDSQALKPRKDGYQSVPTFFPDASSPDRGTRVFVQPGDEAVADIRICVAPTHQIYGKIAEIPPGLRTQDLRLEISPLGERQIGVLRRRATIRDDRSFSIEGLPSGAYEIRLSAVREEHVALVSKGEVEIGSEDVTDLVLAPVESVSFNLRAQLADRDGAITGTGVVLKPTGWGTSYGQPVGSDRVAKVDSVEPDRYLLDVHPGQPGLYLASLQLDGRNVLHQYVDLSQTSGVTVTALLRSGAGTIDGLVAPDADTVVLAPQSPCLDGSDIHLQAVKYGGTFEFSNVVPGDYLLYAAQAGENGQLLIQPAFLNALKEVGTAVHVGENELQHVKILPRIKASTLRARAMSVGFYFQ